MIKEVFQIQIRTLRFVSKEFKNGNTGLSEAWQWVPLAPRVN